MHSTCVQDSLPNSFVCIWHGCKILFQICLHFYTKEESWKTVAYMKEARESAACAVFQGNIIVSGVLDDYGSYLNSVESYELMNGYQCLIW